MDPLAISRSNSADSPPGWEASASRRQKEFRNQCHFSSVFFFFLSFESSANVPSKDPLPPTPTEKNLHSHPDRLLAPFYPLNVPDHRLKLVPGLARIPWSDVGVWTSTGGAMASGKPWVQTLVILRFFFFFWVVIRKHNSQSTVSFPSPWARRVVSLSVFFLENGREMGSSAASGGLMGTDSDGRP